MTIFCSWLRKGGTGGATKTKGPNKGKIKEQLLTSLINSETEGLKKQTDKVEKFEDVATEKPKETIRAKKKNMNSTVHQQSKIFQRFQQKEKFNKRVKDFKVHQTEMTFKINIVILIDTHPE